MASIGTIAGAQEMFFGWYFRSLALRIVGALALGLLAFGGSLLGVSVFGFSPDTEMIQAIWYSL